MDTEPTRAQTPLNPAPLPDQIDAPAHCDSRKAPYVWSTQTEPVAEVSLTSSPASAWPSERTWLSETSQGRWAPSATRSRIVPSPTTETVTGVLAEGSAPEITCGLSWQMIAVAWHGRLRSPRPANYPIGMDDRICAHCGTPAPATETAYTLISSRHGWRLQYEVDARGERQPKWWCGDCWRRRKAAPH